MFILHSEKLSINHLVMFSAMVSISYPPILLNIMEKKILMHVHPWKNLSLNTEVSVLVIFCEHRNSPVTSCMQVYVTDQEPFTVEPSGNCNCSAGSYKTTDVSINLICLLIWNSFLLNLEHRNIDSLFMSYAFTVKSEVIVFSLEQIKKLNSKAALLCLDKSKKQAITR